MGVGEDGAAFDFAPCGDYRVAFEALAVKAEVGRAMGVESIDLGEVTVIEQLCQTLAGGEFAA